VSSTPVSSDVVTLLTCAASFDTANYSLPSDLHFNNSAYVFQENKAPLLLDSLVGNASTDGHDYRSDFNWIVQQDYNWVITDTPDEWHERLQHQGKRNLSWMIADGQEAVDGAAKGWYRRRHARDLVGN
jgi:hypothetical protein